jgi:predicted amidophosphoribosyltransferase
MGLFRERCTFCGARVRKGAQFCTGCGAEMYKCPYCSGKIDENARVCPHCAAEFTKPRFLGGKCPSCGKEVSKFRQFCPHCGADAETLLRKCSDCGALAKAGSQFCSMCGAPIAHRGSVVVDEVRWRRKPGEFARRFDIEDIRGLLQIGVTVDHGTQAMLMQDGALARTLSPGFYGIDSAWQEVKLDHSMSVLAADTGNTEMEFIEEEALSRDRIKYRVRVALVVELAAPQHFLANVMKGEEAYSVVQLRDYLAPEVRDAIAEAVRQHDSNALKADAAIKARITSDLFNHMRSTLDRLGLHLVQLRSLDLNQPEVAKLDAAEGKTAMMENLRDISRRRIDVWDELKKLAASKKMLEVANEEELAKFMRDVDKDRLIRDEEMKDLKFAFAEKREDRELARKHLLGKLDIEQRLERQRLDLLGQADIEREVAEVRLSAQRAQLEAELHEQRERDLVNLQLELKRKIDGAQADLDIQEAKVKLGFYARQQKIEMDHKEDSLRIARELQQREKEVEIEGKRAEMFSKASVEALIAMSGPEQARMLADLQRTEQLKGMSEDQILALASEKSPAVAAALAEKFKAAAQGQMDAEVKGVYAQWMNSNKEMYQTGMQMMKDVATAAAGQHIAYPPPGVNIAPGAPAYPAPPSTPAVCPNCKRPAPATSAFCDTCGQALT